MKQSIILLTFIALSLSQNLTCSDNRENYEMCTEEYNPVCGYNLNQTQINTFSNGCFACQNENVAYYEKQPCEDQEEGNSQDENQQNSTTHSIYAVLNCIGPKIDNPICPAIVMPTCGLFNQNIQCIRAPCGQMFGNSCEACANINVDRYFIGDCEDYQGDIGLPDEKNDEYKECPEQRPEMCTLEYTYDLCSFTQFPCYEDSCMKEGGNQCDVCQNTNTVGYIMKKCSEYKLMFTDNQNPLQLDEKNQTTLQCTESPNICDESVETVCASYKCNDTICQKEFSNPCKACIDSGVLSYYKGNCQQTNYGAILGFALISLAI